MQATGTGQAVTYLEGGVYPRSQALNLSGYYDQNKSWLAYPGQSPVLEGSGATSQAVVISGFPGITIQGMIIDRFTVSGIFAQYASGLVISGNTVQNVTTPDWRTNTLGASIFLLNVQDSQVSNNKIANNTYTGIQVNAGGSGQTNSNTVIEGNTVVNVCTAVVDCGAIYLRDVGHQSTGEVVSGNIVDGFGPAANATKGIYLDDEQSNVTVARNTVFGSGTYAFQIHGGDSNVFVNNIFDLTGSAKLALYQDDVTSGFPNYGMTAMSSPATSSTHRRRRQPRFGTPSTGRAKRWHCRPCRRTSTTARDTRCPTPALSSIPIRYSSGLSSSIRPRTTTGCKPQHPRFSSGFCNPIGALRTYGLHHLRSA